MWFDSFMQTCPSKLDLPFFGSVDAGREKPSSQALIENNCVDMNRFLDFEAFAHQVFGHYDVKKQGSNL